MFTDDDLLPISALQHLIFCERQAALIHLEHLWMENPLTVEGQDLHRVVDEAHAENRAEVQVHRGVQVQSRQLGLTGKADVIEFHPVRPGETGMCLAGKEGLWTIVPIEYKRGRPKAHQADEVQLCAQAVCLEELYGTEVKRAYLFYGRTRRRESVCLTPALRDLTRATATALHDLIRSGVTPIREQEKKCGNCSLEPLCLPPKRSRPPSVRSYLDAVLLQALTEADGP